jgi:Asp-tRNA(Asn)/Glu-tRNA(Gln) amidotransferase B subunit
MVADPSHAKQLSQYNKGKGRMLKYFVGQAMKVGEARSA